MRANVVYRFSQVLAPIATVATAGGEEVAQERVVEQPAPGER
jgi:hypothetical protein